MGHLAEYVRLKPTDVQGYLNLGHAFLGTGAFADALRTFVQGLGQASDAGGRQELARELLDGGRQALAAGRATAAVDFLREYVRHDPANASAYLTLGRAYLQAGQVGSAWAAFERVLELNPNDPEASQFLRGRR
ncbi:MAG: tetratricopeptide repeat protein [Candidatus Rokubacteria bacterium]|nr:tetratricopeptide repeat protein [Candidatus Rokubacteria bacterium]